jgi:hypothetical protein
MCYHVRIFEPDFYAPCMKPTVEPHTVGILCGPSPRRSFRNCSVLTGGLLGFKLVLRRVWLCFAGVAGPNLVVASALPGVVERGVSL